jgi:hypothetical protein
MRLRLSVLARWVLSASMLNAQTARLGNPIDGFTAKWGQPFRNTGGMI